MTSRRKDYGIPDRNQIDPRLAVDDLAIVYGFPEGSPSSIINGKEVMITGPLNKGKYTCDVDGYPQSFHIAPENLMYLDTEDIIIISVYDEFLPRNK